MNDFTAVKKQWFELLTDDERRFILRVRDSNGAKHGADPCADCDGGDDSARVTVFWEKPESLGFIDCLGPYKWRATKKFYDFELYTMLERDETK